MSQRAERRTRSAVALSSEHLPQALALSQALQWPYRAENWAFALAIRRLDQAASGTGRAALVHALLEVALVDIAATATPVEPPPLGGTGSQWRVRP